MRRFRVLVIADHSRHSEHNSIYAILNEMLDDVRCHEIDVVSRGIAKNHDFFTNSDSSKIYASPIDPDFKFTNEGFYFNRQLRLINIESYDIILMRLPRPVSDDWLTWLAKISKKSVFINHPSGIIKTSNKKYLLNFPRHCQDMKLCRSNEDVEEMLLKFPIVLKPLKEYGGKGIVKITGNEVDTGNAILSKDKYLRNIKSELADPGYIAMKYLKNVSKGDKRILVVGGEIMGASLRLPAEASWLCNISQGGQSVKAEATAEEEDLIKDLAPILMKEGILIFGADTLEDDNGKRILSEVNTLSIGGFPQAQEQSGLPIIKKTINKIFDYADEYRK